jgi:hypothetical protein
MGRKKISVLIVTLFLTSVVILPKDLNVKASEEGPDLDYGFVYNITKDLSNIVFNVKSDGLDKGRAFGTAGEHQSALDIKDWMENESYAL